MKRKPTHPGELLATGILPALGLDEKDFATKIGFEESKLSAVLRGEAPMTQDLADKLGKEFNNSPQFWMNLQSGYDEQISPSAKRIGSPASRLPPPR